MECVKECCKKEDFKDIYEKVNAHGERLIASEVKLGLILWGLALVVTLSAANLFQTFQQNKERAEKLYYNHQTSSQEAR